MRARLLVAVLAAAIGAFVLGSRFLTAERPGIDAPARAGTVVAGSFEVWSSYEGILEARRMRQVAAQVDGSAVLIELAPEGARVRAGGVLARFDVADAEADLVRLEHEVLRAVREAEGLREAELPLERLEMEAQVFEAEHALAAEERFLEATRELAGRGLVAAEEVGRQADRVAGLQARLDQARTRLALTLGHMHPARLARAEASLATLAAQKERVRRRVENGRILAPGDGVVVHLPLPLGGSFRAVHVGDTLHRNQVFMALPDMDDAVVRFRIPESDLPRVSPGAVARIRPVAFPDRVIEGAVEQVSAMAQAMPGDPPRRKTFAVVLSLGQPQPGLPSGITVAVDIRSYANDDAVQVPRSAVRWREGSAEVGLLRNGRPVRHRIVPGWAGEHAIEVREGLSPGDRVELP